MAKSLAESMSAQSPPKTSDAPKATLARGVESDDVKSLQKGLNEKFGTSLKVDGKFGRQTMNAVKDFQKATGLKADGVVGDKTHGKLGEPGKVEAKKAAPAGAKAGHADHAGHKHDEADEAGATAKPGKSGFQNPVPGGRFSSGFGHRHAPKKGASTNHKGLDIAAPAGTKVGASKGGVVTQSGFQKGYGNIVEVRHADGTKTRYAHLGTRSVKVGQEVDAGAKLGGVGQTGTATGNHLHFEVRDKANKPLDPAKFL